MEHKQKYRTQNCMIETKCFISLKKAEREQIRAVRL